MSVTNRPAHLRNTLRSWKNVEYPDWDFTLIDDATIIQRLRTLPETQASPSSSTGRVTTFRLAVRHELSVAWLGVGATITKLLRGALNRLAGQATLAAEDFKCLRMRLMAWAIWRFASPTKE